MIYAKIAAMPTTSTETAKSHSQKIKVNYCINKKAMMV